MEETVQSKAFFDAWHSAVMNHKAKLLAAWRHNTELTNCMLNRNDSIILDVAEKLKLQCYPINYYSLDAVMYSPDDLVPNIPDHMVWLRNVQVAFEHENTFKSGLYKEVSHLLITKCALRVLVTYPNSDKEEEEELKYLHEIIKGTNDAESISEDQSFLIIFGYENGFKWVGKVFKMDKWDDLK